MQMHTSVSLLFIVPLYPRATKQSQYKLVFFSYGSVQAFQFGFLTFYFLIKMEVLHSGFFSVAMINYSDQKQEEETAYLFLLFQVTVKH